MSYITEVEKKGPGRPRGFRKLNPKSAWVSGVRCHPEFREKLSDHLVKTGQKESEFKLEALNYYINKQRGDI